MNYTKIALLLIVAFLAYKFLYRAPEVEYGQYSGPGESAPKLSGREVIGHMRVHLGSRNYGAGHGFVLKVGVRKYVVSASHIIMGSFKDVDKVDVMSNGTALVADARPALGPSYDTCTMEDARRDVTFYTTDSERRGGDLSLAPEPPLVGQKVWLLCTQDREAATGKLIPAEVTFSSSRALKYTFQTGVKFDGTSGCPVVNSAKQLVGVNVCGYSQAGVAVPLPTILESLDEI